jgi:hypothetical protein
MDEDFNNAMNGVEAVETLNELNEEILNEIVKNPEPNVTQIVSENIDDVNESFLNSIDDTNMFYVKPPSSAKYT